MRTYLAITIALCLTRLCAAAEFNPFEGPKPLAVFIQTDPWEMVIGSDTPRMAVYDSGEVIFVKKLKDGLFYHHITLDKQGLSNLRERIKPLLVLKDLKPFYNVRPNATDQPEAMFYFRDGDREITTSVYGLMAPGTSLVAYTEFPSDAKPTPPPKELLRLHKWLCEIDYSGSKQWTPKYVEVMLWDYSYAPEASILWPKEWPSLKSDRAIKHGEVYSVFLDGALLPKLRAFLATRKEKGAIEVDGKKMADSYRFAFPGEPTWHRAFQAAAEKAAKANDSLR